MSQATLAIAEALRPVAVRQPMQIQGLCRDCVNTFECTFPRDPSRAVRSCEEFEAAEPARNRQTPLLVVAPVFAVAADLTTETTELKGLCRQCAHRLACRFPKPPEGVWQCEELA